jgi:hypothetical protein
MLFSKRFVFSPIGKFEKWEPNRVTTSQFTVRVGKWISGLFAGGMGSGRKQ